MLGPWPVRLPLWPKAPDLLDPVWAQWYSQLRDEVNAAVAAAAAPAAAGTLTGTTLAANVVNSSLTGTGTLTSGATGTGFTVNFTTSTFTGLIPAANQRTTGAYTPTDTSGAGLVITQVVPGVFIRFAELVVIYGVIAYPVTASGANTSLGGLPVPVSATPGGAVVWLNTSGIALVMQANNGTSNLLIRNPLTAANITNVQVSGATLGYVGVYLA